VERPAKGSDCCLEAEEGRLRSTECAAEVGAVAASWAGAV